MIGIPIGETTGLRPGARFIAFGVVSGKSPLTPLGACPSIQIWLDDGLAV